MNAQQKHSLLGALAESKSLKDMVDQRASVSPS
jgi:hypothetical protein